MESGRVSDLTEIDQLLARYTMGMTRDDIASVVQLFTPDGHYSAFGAQYGPEDFPAMVASAPKGLFLAGTAAVELDGDLAQGVQPLCFVDQTTHRMRIGWWDDTYRRTSGGWRIHSRKMTFLRRAGGRDSGIAHDPSRA